MIPVTHIGLLGIRYSIISSKMKALSMLFFLIGMACYMMETVDEKNIGMIIAGILVCIMSLWYHVVGYLLFAGSWIWYSTYMEDKLSCIPATCILALECSLSRAGIATPIVYVGLIAQLFLAERSTVRR
jgi:hypothetical protein